MQFDHLQLYNRYSFSRTLVSYQRSLIISTAVTMFDPWIISTIIFQLNGTVGSFYESVPTISR